MATKTTNGYDDEEMTVELELDDGEIVNCAVITILTVENQDYSGENEDGEVWFYRYAEDESNPNAEPDLAYIDDDEEYDKVADAFDEYLDEQEYDEIIACEEAEQ